MDSEGVLCRLAGGQGPWDLHVAHLVLPMQEEGQPPGPRAGVFLAAPVGAGGCAREGGGLSAQVGSCLCDRQPEFKAF